MSECGVDFIERPLNLDIAAGYGRGIGKAPVCGYRSTGPYGTDFTRRLIADGNDQIHRRCVRFFEFNPILGAKVRYIVAVLLEQRKRKRIDLSSGVAAGAERAELIRAHAI